MGGCAGFVVIPQNVKPKTGLKRRLKDPQESGLRKRKSKKYFLMILMAIWNSYIEYKVASRLYREIIRNFSDNFCITF